MHIAKCLTERRITGGECLVCKYLAVIKIKRKKNGRCSGIRTVCFVTPSSNRSLQELSFLSFVPWLQTNHWNADCVLQKPGSEKTHLRQLSCNLQSSAGAGRYVASCHVLREISVGVLHMVGLCLTSLSDIAPLVPCTARLRLTLRTLQLADVTFIICGGPDQ